MGEVNLRSARDRAAGALRGHEPRRRGIVWSERL